jgi:hypothetical protein
MDELIAAIAEKTGLPADKAAGAATAALEFIKDKLPAPIASQVDGFLSGNADGIGDAVGGVTDKLKGMFGGN